MRRIFTAILALCIVSLSFALFPFALHVSNAQTPTSFLAVPSHALLTPNAVDAAFEQRCSRYWGQKIATTLPSAYGVKQPYALCGYAGRDFRKLYGITGFGGKGQAVGIVDAYSSPTITQDVNAYSAAHNLPVLSKSQLTALPAKSYDEGDVCGSSGWAIEETLDIEAVHSIAPRAKIVYSAAGDCSMESLDRANLRLVRQGVVHQISNSYGLGIDAQYLPHLLEIAAESVYQRAAKHHIGEYFAAGDNGPYSVDSSGTTIASPTFPSTSPYVTAVGGTALMGTANGGYRQEIAWSTGESWRSRYGTYWNPAVPGYWIWGAGGGQSQYFPQPRYQARIVPKSISEFAYDYGTSAPVRVTPDVSLDADPATGMLVGITQEWPNGKTYYGELVVGGTSLASPLMAGIGALIDQASGKHVGLLNPLLYRLPGKAFHDVVAPASPIAALAPDPTGNTTWDGLFTLGIPQVYAAVSGYDLQTGRGSLRAGWVLDRLARLK